MFTVGVPIFVLHGSGTKEFVKKESRLMFWVFCGLHNDLHTHANLSHSFSQTIEHYSGKPLFTFGGSEPYIKDTTEHPLKKTLQIGNMGIPVTAYEEGDAEPLETRVSFADESGKPVKTVASAEGEVTLDDEPAEAAGCGLFGQIGSLEAASPSSSTGS